MRQKAPARRSHNPNEARRSVPLRRLYGVVYNYNFTSKVSLVFVNQYENYHGYQIMDQEGLYYLTFQVVDWSRWLSGGSIHRAGL